MDSERFPSPDERHLGDVGDFSWEEPDALDQEVVLHPPRSYRRALGGAPIRVGIVEFRIMLFLASRPYHAFTRREIAAAATLPDRPVTENEVDRYVTSLREQLGILHDYVQTVPYVGYRFKA